MERPAPAYDEIAAANDRIAASARRLRFTARVPFLCECLDPQCRELVLLALGDHAAARAAGAPLVADGHAAGSGVDELERIA